MTGNFIIKPDTVVADPQVPGCCRCSRTCAANACSGSPLFLAVLWVIPVIRQVGDGAGCRRRLTIKGYRFTDWIKFLIRPQASNWARAILSGIRTKGFIVMPENVANLNSRAFISGRAKGTVLQVLERINLWYKVCIVSAHDPALATHCRRYNLNLRFLGIKAALC